MCTRPGGCLLSVRDYDREERGKGPARRFHRDALLGVHGRRGQGVSVQTTNYYLSHLKSFCAWLAGPAGRMASSPFAALEPGNSAAGRRHARRELTADELRRLLDAARTSPRTFRGLTGEGRFHLHALACGTGFRAGGLASLTPACFDLAASTPTVTLPAQADKSRRGKVQPLPADVAELFRGYLAGRPADRPVWPGTWARHFRGAAMLRTDLDAAGIPYAVEGPDGPLDADFHALRHTYLTLGSRAGIDLRTLQELAGHSTPALTARYSHVRLHDLAGAVGKLPGLLPSAAEGSSVSARATEVGGLAAAGAYTPLTQISDGGGREVMAADGLPQPPPPLRLAARSRRLGS